MFSNLKAKISGYKTYAVAAIAILSAIVAWSGNQISTWNALQTILAACATVTMRAAVSKATVPTGVIVHQWDAIPAPPPAVKESLPTQTVTVTSNPKPIGEDR